MDGIVVHHLMTMRAAELRRAGGVVRPVGRSPVRRLLARGALAVARLADPDALAPAGSGYTRRCDASVPSTVR